MSLPYHSEYENEDCEEWDRTAQYQSILAPWMFSRQNEQIDHVLQADDQSATGWENGPTCEEGEYEMDDVDLEV